MNQQFLSKLKAEYQSNGFIRDSFSLNDPDLCTPIIEELEYYRKMESEDLSFATRGVPYLVTHSIEAISRDEGLTAVVSAILGERRWVMWGANLRTGTPNSAQHWHVDLESWLWPSVTIVIGLQGCDEQSATWCIPTSHSYRTAPSRMSESELTRLETQAEQFNGFSNKRFYVFNAKCWHRGSQETKSNRHVLFLHYQAASDRRVPLMLDYDRHKWSREPCPYIVGPGIDPVVTKLAGFPLGYRLGKLRRRLYPAS